MAQEHFDQGTAEGDEAILDILDLMKISRTVSIQVVGFYSKLRWEAPRSGVWHTSAQELAQIFDLSPRTIARYLSQLVDLNMITYVGTTSGCRIFIRKKGGMTNLAEGYDKFGKPLPKTPGGYDKFGKGGMTNLAEPPTEQTYSPKPEQAPFLGITLEEEKTDPGILTKSETPTIEVGNSGTAEFSDEGKPADTTTAPPTMHPPRSGSRVFSSCPHTYVEIPEYWNPLSWVEYKEKLHLDPQALPLGKRRIWQQIETHYSPRDIRLDLLHKANEMDWPMSYLISLFTVTDGIPRLSLDAKREKPIVYQQLAPLPIAPMPPPEEAAALMEQHRASMRAIFGDDFYDKPSELQGYTHAIA